MTISRIARACDGCRLRKVRCEGRQPCSQCTHLHLDCVFSRVPSKRKPPVRGRLVAQLRQGRRPARSDEGRASASASASVYETLRQADRVGIHSNGGSSYTAAFFHDLIPAYTEVVYPVNPIISPPEVCDAIAAMASSYEDAAFVFAFAAVTINLSQTTWWSEHGDVAVQLTDLIEHSIRAHRLVDLPPQADGPGGILGDLHVSVKRIMTCVFLECSMISLRCKTRGVAILREGIAMLQMLRIRREEEQLGLLEQPQLQPQQQPVPTPEVCLQQRLYGELCVHELTISLTSGYPMGGLRLGDDDIPAADATLPEHIDAGFRRIVKLFRIVDESFLRYWTAMQHQQHQQHQQRQRPDPCQVASPREDKREIHARWIEQKQAELDRDELEAAEEECSFARRGVAGLTELQYADLFVTRVWLRTLVWELALSRGLLRSAPPRDAHSGFSLHFPAQRLSSDLRSLVCRLHNVASIGIHGSGILQKLFEITSTVADVLALPVSSQSQLPARDVQAQLDNFMFLVQFLFSFERIRKEQRTYLREKLERVQEMHTAADFGALALESPGT